MGMNNTGFGVKCQHILVTRHLLNYKEISVATLIYIRRVVISIVLFTYMFAIELFYLTHICSFLGCFFEYLPIFIPYRILVYHLQSLSSSGRFCYVPLFVRR